MNQKELNQFVSSLLTNKNIKHKISREADDPRLSNYNIVVQIGEKIENKVIVFSTFAYSSCDDIFTMSGDLNLAESLICCDENDDLFDISFSKFYTQKNIYSSDRIIQSEINGDKNEIIQKMREEIYTNVSHVIDKFFSEIEC